MSDDLTLQLIAERIKSLSDLTELRFNGLEDDLGDIKDVSQRVSNLESRFTDGLRRVELLERAELRGAAFRRGPLWANVLTLGLMAVGIGSIIVAALH